MDCRNHRVVLKKFFWRYIYKFHTTLAGTSYRNAEVLLLSFPSLLVVLEFILQAFMVQDTPIHTQFSVKALLFDYF